MVLKGSGEKQKGRLEISSLIGCKSVVKGPNCYGAFTLLVVLLCLRKKIKEKRRDHNFAHLFTSKAWLSRWDFYQDEFCAEHRIRCKSLANGLGSSFKNTPGSFHIIFCH